MRYFFRVEYDGSRFGGWQRQPNTMSIQEHLENAFSVALRHRVAVTGAGRTDAGVHAKAQGAHVNVADTIDVKRCERSVNALLPPEISIYEMRPVDDSFHARFSAFRRRYKYYMAFRKRPLQIKRAWMIYFEVDWDKVQNAVKELEGKFDFGAFCASGSGAKSNICHVRHTALEWQDDLLVFTIEADRFIYKMVRSIVGTLVDIGRGKIEHSVKDIIMSKDRSFVGTTAPPTGLVLDYVGYPGVEL